MKPKEIEAIESYLKTENNHWNKFALEMLCEVMQLGNFEKAETPLFLFDRSLRIFALQWETPLKAVDTFEAEVSKAQLNLLQKAFIYEWVYKYVRLTDFDEIDLNEIKALLKSQTEKNRKEIQLTQSTQPLTVNIRATLKKMMQKEIEQLPKTLEKLDAVQRLNLICKLLPYVLPRVESVAQNKGEPDEFKVKQWNEK